MRFVRVGRFTLNVDLAKKRTGLEPYFVVTGEDAELLRRHLAPFTAQWRPVAPRKHPRGPLGPEPQSAPDPDAT